MTAPVRSRNSVWDDAPETYEALREGQGWLNQRRALFFREWLETNAPEGSVLEIGSGTGSLNVKLLANLPDIKLVGVDPLPSYVAFAESNVKKHGCGSRARFLQGKAEQLNTLVPSRAFDAIISSDVLHHIDDLDKAIQAAAMVAKPGALWCSIEPNALNPYAFFNQWRRPNERNFWPLAFQRTAEKSGWELVEKKYLFLIPPLIPRPGEWLKKLERRFEGIPFLGGGIVMVLRRVRES